MSPYAKAITATVVGGLGSLAVAGIDNAITLGEALVAASVAAASGAAVFGVRNGQG